MQNKISSQKILNFLERKSNVALYVRNQKNIRGRRHNKIGNQLLIRLIIVIRIHFFRYVVFGLQSLTTSFSFFSIRSSVRFKGSSASRRFQILSLAVTYDFGFVGDSLLSRLRNLRQIKARTSLIRISLLLRYLLSLLMLL